MSKEILNEIINYISNNNDIHRVYECINKNDLDIILIVSDSTQDIVLDHIDFMFNLRHKYNTIHDFMVIDETMEYDIQYMYDKYSIVHSV
ncbi:MAG: hypothetical protein J6A59_04160 [Lachnospiraceae bacterium]|nr:hypothetical protein [Lachnospiraceae bacterium]